MVAELHGVTLSTSEPRIRSGSEAALGSEPRSLFQGSDKAPDLIRA
eukprot:CAMPEP_0184392128 /NCGR_PEP_ID=MMETSP0007-20130409/24406_1 /TAXON_ID=97485 /ORGANISM="Prymnesium parvum, Strain Texoma1" /LENGTH=45 /DNA_ID= /DNA_START= /DNA_END= /DNA_ORIENTATION=